MGWRGQYFRGGSFGLPRKIPEAREGIGKHLFGRRTGRRLGQTDKKGVTLRFGQLAGLRRQVVELRRQGLLGRYEATCVRSSSSTDPFWSAKATERVLPCCCDTPLIRWSALS